MRVNEARIGSFCLVVSLLLSLGLFSASAHETGAYFSATVSGTFTGTVGGDSYSVIATTTGGGGTVSPASQSVTSGASATVLVTPDSGYHIATITDNGAHIATASPVVLTGVTADHTITATFAKNAFTITVTQGANGTITPGTTTLSGGSGATFRIEPRCGYRIAAVTVDGRCVGAVGSYTFAGVTANHTITAAFAKNTCTITVTQGANGTITPGTTSVSYGGSATFRIAPKCGYRVVSVIVDGTSAGAVTSYTFAGATADHTLTAAFAKNTYTITVTQGDHGTITPGTTNVDAGSSFTFQIVPATGYHVVALTVDGASVGVRASYTFNCVSANHTIAATFAANTFAITVTQGSNGTISPGSTNVSCGATVTFRITPKCGYKIVSVTVDCKSVGVLSSYTFNCVSANHTITAKFAKDSNHGCEPVRAIELSAVQEASVSSETTVTPSPPAQPAAQAQVPAPQPGASPEPAAPVEIAAGRVEVAPQPAASREVPPTATQSPSPTPTVTPIPTSAPTTSPTPTPTPTVSLDTTGAVGE